MLLVLSLMVQNVEIIIFIFVLCHLQRFSIHFERY